MHRRRKRRYLHPVFTVTKILPDCGDEETSSSSSSSDDGSSHTSIWPSNHKSRQRSNTKCGSKGIENDRTESSLRDRSRASSNGSNGKRPFATSKSGSHRRRAKTNVSSSSNDDGSCRDSSNDSRRSRSSSNDSGSSSSNNFDGGNTQSSSGTPLMPNGSEISQKPADRRSDVAEEKSTATVTMNVRNGRGERRPHNFNVVSDSGDPAQGASPSQISKPKNVKSHLANRQFDETSKPAVYRRKLRSEVVYKCAFCTLSFKSKSVFLEHRLSHTGTRPHICEKCGKSFRKRGHLKQHYSVHDDSRSFKCTVCEKSYKAKFNLQRHQRSHADRTL